MLQHDSASVLQNRVHCDTLALLPHCMQQAGAATNGATGVCAIPMIGIARHITITKYLRQSFTVATFPYRWRTSEPSGIRVIPTLNKRVLLNPSQATVVGNGSQCINTMRIYPTASNSITPCCELLCSRPVRVSVSVLGADLGNRTSSAILNKCLHHGTAIRSAPLAQYFCTDRAKDGECYHV
jgi:hypothetical protein